MSSPLLLLAASFAVAPGGVEEEGSGGSAQDVLREVMGRFWQCLTMMKSAVLRSFKSFGSTVLHGKVFCEFALPVPSWDLNPAA